MNLQEQINQHLKNAILTSNTEVKSILRVLIGEFNRIGKTVTDEQVISIVKKMIDNAKLVGNEGEIEILNAYLPKQLDENQLAGIISALIFSNNYTIKDMGKIMSELKNSYNGQYDGKLASNLIKEIFSKSV